MLKLALHYNHNNKKNVKFQIELCLGKVDVKTDFLAKSLCQ